MKRESQKFWICVFKQKKKERNEGKLKANGRFQAWWPLEWIWCLVVNGETSLFNGQWKVSSLVTLECSMFGCLWKENEKHLFHLQKILLKHLFHWFLKFYLTMVLNCYFMSFLLLHWLINYIHASRCTKSSKHSSSTSIWSKIFSFLWIHGINMITFDMF